MHRIVIAGILLLLAGTASAQPVPPQHPPKWAVPFYVASIVYTWLCESHWGGEYKFRGEGKSWKCYLPDVRPIG